MTEKIIKFKSFIEIIFIFCFVVLIWGLTHFFTLNWGLPNLFSFAIDTIPPQTNFSAIQMMKHENCQYPPLQYKIVELFYPPITDEESKKTDILLQSRSNKIFKMRLISAVMTLFSALTLAFFSKYYFNSNIISLSSAFFFITTPISLYYSHTSNMDQPYLMWWSFSVCSLVLAYFALKEKHIARFVILNFFSAIFFALSFCTKDQVYSLYILPLILYLFLIFRIKQKPIYILITLALWIIVFTLITGLVYWSSGGWNIFITHIKWIINSEHQILYSQCKNGVFGRIKFLLKTFSDLSQCLDFPLLVVFVISIVLMIPFISRYLLRNSMEQHQVLCEKLYNISIFFFLTFISMQLFFINITRFSFPRYFLPLLPIVSCSVPVTILLIQQRFKKMGIIIFTALIIYQSLLCYQFLNALHNDTRMILRDFFCKLSEKGIMSEARIALTGVTNFRKVVFYFDPYTNFVERKTVLVNEPLPTFGFISENQKSLEKKYSSLILYDPQVVINSKLVDPVWEEILSNTSFQKILQINKPNNIVFSFFQRDMPVFSIFVKTKQIEINKDIILKEYADKSFEENLMSLANNIDIRQINRQVQIVGNFFPSFKEPDIKNNHIKLVIIDFLADAYEMAGRLEDSARARIFLLKHTTDENLLNRSLKFFEKYPILNNKNQNL